MKKLLLPVVLMFLGSMSLAQLPSYDVALIPEGIKKGADIIKRYESILFEVTDIDRATLKTHEAYTVMNEEGRSALHFGEYASKFKTIEDVEIKVYDAQGKQINKYKKKDLRMVANSDGLIADGMYSYFTVTAPSYPVTVEYIYEVRYKGSLFYPGYSIITPGEGVQQSSFTAKVPKELDLRFKEKNISLPAKISGDDKYKVYQWSVNNMPPIAYEAGAISSESRYPSILLAPNHFKMDDYEGDMTSWKNLGTWYFNMHKGVDELPEDRKLFLKNLVKDAKDDREKVKIIYNYLQNNFRYVSIQLGIGGWRSLPAGFTDQKKYGDCKGLSQYMHAALQVVGVKSYTALINSEYNKEPLDPAFPMNGFNHVILCVPQLKDSIWLECTSNTIDFGVLGSSTENRNALLITPEGGVLVATPSSSSSSNRFDVSTTISLQPDGSGKTTTTFNTTGSYKGLMRSIIDEKKDDQKEAIVYYLGFHQPDEFMVTQKDNAGQYITELEMKLEKIPEFMAGAKMFISPRQYKLCLEKLPKAENRKLDYYFYYPYQKTDTTILQLPDGFEVDALPQGKQLQCRYANYATKYWYDTNKKSIYSTTTLTLNQMKIPAADYADIKKFFEDVVQDDAQRIVIKKP